MCAAKRPLGGEVPKTITLSKLDFIINLKENIIEDKRKDV